MQRIKWIDRKLVDWATWRMASPGGYRSPSFEYVEHGLDPQQNGIEISAAMEAGALEMDQAIATLPTELRAAVVAYYTWEGGMGTVTDKLRVTRATVHRRLCQADLRISAWLETRETIKRTQAARLV